MITIEQWVIVPVIIMLRILMVIYNEIFRTVWVRFSASCSGIICIIF